MDFLTIPFVKLFAKFSYEKKRIELVAEWRSPTFKICEVQTIRTKKHFWSAEHTSTIHYPEEGKPRVELIGEESEEDER